MPINLDSSEMVSMRQFSRAYGRFLDALQDGDAGEKLVLVKDGQLAGVVVSVEEYERLVDKGGRVSGSKK